MRSHRRAHAALLVLASVVWACEETDIGRCCEMVGGELATKCAQMDPICPIPQIEPDPNGGFKAIFATDPKFDCDELACVSYEGAKAYCTKECLVDSNCPENFVCAQVIVSKAGPDMPPKTACVRHSTMPGMPFACTQ